MSDSKMSTVTIKLGPKRNTTNKSDRNIDEQFDQRQFNQQFLNKQEQIEEENKFSKSDDIMRHHEIVYGILPHQKPIEDIIVNIREMFYKSLEMLIDKQNPIPYLFSTPDRQFSLSVFLIIIGALLLMFSNLMKSSEEK